MASASTRVFETYELLEIIIASLDSPHKILVIQRVCRTWRAVIQRSAGIQDRFLGPSTRELARPKSKGPVGIVYDEKFVFNDVWIQPRRAYVESSLFVPNTHELVARKFEFDRKSCGSTDKSSYRKLFLTRPPCTTAFVRAWKDDQKGEVHPATLHDSNGITLGLLEDVARNVDSWADHDSPSVVYVVVEIVVPNMRAPVLTRGTGTKMDPFAALLELAECARPVLEPWLRKSQRGGRPRPDAQSG